VIKKCRSCGEQYDVKEVGRPTPYCYDCRRDRHLRQMKAWRAAHKLYVKEKAALWRAAHRDELRAKNRDYMRKYRAKKRIEKLLK